MSVTIVYVELYIAHIYEYILQKKYDCHTAYENHTTNILNWYIKTTNCNTFYCQILARNKYADKFGTYTKDLIDVCGRCILKYVSYVKSLQSTM